MKMSIFLTLNITLPQGLWKSKRLCASESCRLKQNRAQIRVTYKTEHRKRPSELNFELRRLLCVSFYGGAAY